jgi:hypothetical protein
MPALTLATLTMLAPRGRDDYLAHLAGPGKAELDKAGILQSKLRLAISWHRSLMRAAGSRSKRSR